MPHWRPQPPQAGPAAGSFRVPASRSRPRSHTPDDFRHSTVDGDSSAGCVHPMRRLGQRLIGVGAGQPIPTQRAVTDDLGPGTAAGQQLLFGRIGQSDVLDLTGQAREVPPWRCQKTTCADHPRKPVGGPQPHGAVVRAPRLAQRKNPAARWARPLAFARSRGEAPLGAGLANARRACTSTSPGVRHASSSSVRAPATGSNVNLPSTMYTSQTSPAGRHLPRIRYLTPASPSDHRFKHARFGQPRTTPALVAKAYPALSRPASRSLWHRSCCRRKGRA